MRKIIILLMPLFMLHCSDPAPKAPVNNQNNVNNLNNVNNVNNGETTTFRLRNGSGEPLFAYENVGSAEDCAAGNAWLDIEVDGATARIFSSCTVCVCPADMCAICDVACAAVDARTQQLASGDAREFVWDRTLLEADTDQQCFSRGTPDAETLTARFCWATSVSGNGVDFQADDTRCETVDFALDDAEVEFEIEQVDRPPVTLELVNNTGAPVYMNLGAIETQCEPAVWLGLDSEGSPISVPGCGTCECEGDPGRGCPDCALACEQVSLDDLTVEDDEKRSFIWDRTTTVASGGQCVDREVLSGEVTATFCWSETPPNDASDFTPNLCETITFDALDSDVVTYDIGG